ncbi:MAG: beta-ketoacyl synthase N-terminal-like domain-containing protein [Planctomycetota bacterium]
MQNVSSRRVVITGVGVVSPLGNDPEKLVEDLRGRASAIRPLEQVPHGVLSIDHGAEAIEFTGAIDDYGPLEKPLKRTIKKAGKLMCREIELGVAVAQKALHDSGLDAEARDRDRTGVLYGCDYIMSQPIEFAAGIAKCLGEDGFDFSRWGEQGKPEVTPLWLLKYLPNMPASHIAIYNDLRGPNNSITVREASACAAIAEAFSTIARGHADVLVVGATGSRIHPLRSLHADMQETLASKREDPATMSRPFTADRDGSVLGEGAGALILESEDHALARGANILGEIVGYGSSAVGPAFGSDFLRTAFRNVMRSALGEEAVEDIGHVHAHGLATPECDAQEAAAIEEIFGPVSSQPPITTAKGHFGNLGAGGGMVEVIASLKSLGGSLFPIRNCDSAADDCPVRVCVSDDQPAGDQFISVNITPQGQASAVRVRSYSE